MFFEDSAAAFANIRRALISGGRLPFVCWREVRANTWASVTIGIARRHIELPPRPGPVRAPPARRGAPDPHRYCVGAAAARG